MYTNPKPTVLLITTFHILLRRSETFKATVTQDVLDLKRDMEKIKMKIIGLHSQTSCVNEVESDTCVLCSCICNLQMICVQVQP